MDQQQTSSGELRLMQLLLVAQALDFATLVQQDSSVIQQELSSQLLVESVTTLQQAQMLVPNVRQDTFANLHLLVIQIKSHAQLALIAQLLQVSVTSHLTLTLLCLVHQESTVWEVPTQPQIVLQVPISQPMEPLTHQPVLLCQKVTTPTQMVLVTSTATCAQVVITAQPTLLMRRQMSVPMESSEQPLEPDKPVTVVTAHLDTIVHSRQLHHIFAQEVTTAHQAQSIQKFAQLELSVQVRVLPELKSASLAMEEDTASSML